MYTKVYRSKTLFTFIPFLKSHADKVFRLSTGNGQTPVLNENARYFFSIC